jgi:hypothetical protein
MPPSAAATASRAERTCCVLDRLVPLMQTHGLPYGYSGFRWVWPPFSAVLRSDGANRLEITVGSRELLIAEWQDAGVRVRHFARGDWDAGLLASLPPWA